MKRLLLMFACAAMLASPGALLAQEPGPPQRMPGAAPPAPMPPGQPGPPPIDENLFPPDLVMRNQRAIGLSEDQSRAILKLSQESQSAMMEAQWGLSREVEALGDLLKQSRVDEGAVKTQFARVLAVENRVKEQQMLFMVRVKNLLSEEQQKKLRALRPRVPEPPPAPMPPGVPPER